MYFEDAPPSLSAELFAYTLPQRSWCKLGNKLKGIVPLAGADVKMVEGEKPFTFAVINKSQSGGDIIMRATSSEIAEQWIQAIRDAANGIIAPEIGQSAVIDLSAADAVCSITVSHYFFVQAVHVIS